MGRTVVVVVGAALIAAGLALAAWRLFDARHDSGTTPEASTPGPDAPAGDDAKADDATPALILLGEELHVKHGCMVCHRTDGTKGLGPSYAEQWGTTVALANGAGATYDEHYVRESILDANAKRNGAYPAIMASYAGKLTEREVLAITLWIKAQTAASREEAYEVARQEPPEPR